MVIVERKMVEKLLAIITVVWFYQSAKSVGEKAVQWALIGLVGFFLYMLLIIVSLFKLKQDESLLGRYLVLTFLILILHMQVMI